MLLLNTLYVDDHRVRVGVRGRALELRAGKTLRGRYPLAELEAVVLTGMATMTTDAIGRCVSAGIRVAAIRRSGAVRFTVGGPVRGNVLLRLHQVRLADHPDRSLATARNIVMAKLQNQRRMIRRWEAAARSRTDRAFLEEQRRIVQERIGAAQRARDGNSLRGLEGDGARRYFKALRNHLAAVAPEMPFGERSRRPPRDPVNALLSFVSAIMTTNCVGALDAVGLDPQIGFFHELRPGRPALALDLLEEFRAPLIDRVCVRMLGRRQLRQGHFHRVAGGAWYLTDEGRHRAMTELEKFKSEPVEHRLLRREVPQALLPVIQATLLARYVRQDLAEYPPFVGGD